MTTIGDAKALFLQCTTPEQVSEAVTGWVERAIPRSWREAGAAGGARAVRLVRSADDYRAWYPTFAASGLVAAQWEVDYGGLGWSRALARAAERALSPHHLPRLNPLGLYNAAPALFAYGTHEQKLRFLPPIVEATEIWCQLFSEPGAGSDLASLACRAVPANDGWLATGQKVWTTWAHKSDFGLLLARTDPDAEKRSGITYFLIDMHQPGVTVRPLVHIGGEVDFNEVFLDDAFVPDSQRLGALNDGWSVARATLSGERQMVSGSGSGGVDRIGGSGASRLVQLALEREAAQLPGGWDDVTIRHRVVELWCDEQIRGWTNDRIRASLQSGRAPGPESSVGKVAGSELNQRIQDLAAQMLGLGATAWPCDAAPDDLETWAGSMPRETHGMLRSRANTIEGGTSEVNRNILAERVLGLAKEPDPWQGRSWRDTPRG